MGKTNVLREDLAARAALAASLTDRSTTEDAAVQDSWEAADERAADRWRGPESDR